MFDARHRFVLTYYWQVPGSKRSNWSRRVTTGWALSGIGTLQSGFPIRITSTSDQELMSSLDYEAVGEPNQIAPFRLLNPQSSGGYYFDPSSFTEAALGTIGNAPRMICCGPPIMNVDFGVHKNFNFAEGRYVQFRAEAFNLLNHTNFAPAGGLNSNSSGFGVFTSTFPARQVQLAAKLIF